MDIKTSNYVICRLDAAIFRPTVGRRFPLPGPEHRRPASPKRCYHDPASSTTIVTESETNRQQTETSRTSSVRVVSM